MNEIDSSNENGNPEESTKALPVVLLNEAAAQVTTDSAIRFGDILSGQFDSEEGIPDVPVAKRILAPMSDAPKLHKVLAQAGMGPGPRASRGAPQVAHQ